MSADRLAALLRQRALVSQHLAWLDSEISAATGIAPAGPPASPLPQPPPFPSGTPAPTPLPPPAAETAPVPDNLARAHARADEIIAQYSASDRFDPVSTKRGCFTLFGAILVLVGGTILAIYFLNYHGR